MQTPAEKELVYQIASFINKRQVINNTHCRLLNIGAGKSVSIEQQLSDLNCHYVCDRIDVNDCTVDFPTTRNCWETSAEDMTPLKTGEYFLAFANYVIEHIIDIQKMCSEIHRVLCPSGIFIASIPNPSAPQFIFAKHTPLFFHKLIRRGEAWETHYSYNNIEKLVENFEANGFDKQGICYWSFTEGYLWKYPIIREFSRLYDRIVTKINHKLLLSDVCVVFKKKLDYNLIP
jgi:SAM-dependent methyltransferase